jgi:hypothetical protein
MSLKSAIAEFFSPAAESDKPEQVAHPSLTSVPMIVLVLFVAGLIWLGRGVLTEENIKLAFWLALASVVCHTATHIVQLLVNGAILRERQKMILGDNKATPEELALLKDAPTSTTAK